MKKILVVLSFLCFAAVNVTNAQTSATVAKVEKKEVVAKTATAESSSATKKSCCKKGSSMKACTPEQRAKCEVNKTKAEANSVEKTEVKSVVKN